MLIYSVFICFQHTKQKQSMRTQLSWEEQYIVVCKVKIRTSNTSFFKRWIL